MAVHLSQSVPTLGANTFTGSQTVPSSGAVIWAGESQIKSPADGILTLLNSAGTAFTSLHFGGDAVGNASISVTTNQFFFKIGDDSATTTVYANNFNSVGTALTGAFVALPAGGAATMGFVASTTADVGLYFGSGVPTLSVHQGSLYIRSDGVPSYNSSSGSGTTWTPLLPSAAPTITGALTYGGVALASTVTGTGSMVLSAAPSLTGATTLVSAAATGLLTAFSGTAPSAAAASVFMQLGSNASFGIWVGNATPTMAATQGSLALSTTGSSTATRLFVRGSAAWIAVTTAS